MFRASCGRTVLVPVVACAVGTPIPLAALREREFPVFVVFRGRLEAALEVLFRHVAKRTEMTVLAAKSLKLHVT